MLLLSTYWKRKIRYLCHMSHAVPANPGTRESNRCFFALSHTRFIKWNNIDEKWLALRDLCSQDSIWNLNAIQSQLHFITVLLLHCSSASFVRSWGAKREINGCIIQASWLELKIQSMYYYLDFDVNISISVLGIYLSFGLRPELFFSFNIHLFYDLHCHGFVMLSEPFQKVQGSLLVFQGSLFSSQNALIANFSSPLVRFLIMLTVAFFF